DARGGRGGRLLSRGRGGRVHHRTHARHRRRVDGAMITKFSVLYVGQIELDNIGRDGTPADARRYSNERFAEAFWTARDIAQTMDELGYYAMWTAEHHFQREGYEVLPNLIQLSLWLATQTKRLKFGCAFNILPMWHPLRLAEDYAMADIVTGGRVITRVGPGSHTREADRERQDHRLHGQARPQGDGDAQRREAPRPGRPGLPRRVRAARPGETARRGHVLGRRRLPRAHPGGGVPPRRAVPRRAVQVV